MLFARAIAMKSLSSNSSALEVWATPAFSKISIAEELPPAQTLKALRSILRRCEKAASISVKVFTLSASSPGDSPR